MISRTGAAGAVESVGLHRCRSSCRWRTHGPAAVAEYSQLVFTNRIDSLAPDSVFIKSNMYCMVVSIFGKNNCGAAPRGDAVNPITRQTSKMAGLTMPAPFFPSFIFPRSFKCEYRPAVLSYIGGTCCPQSGELRKIGVASSGHLRMPRGDLSAVCS